MEGRDELLDREVELGAVEGAFETIAGGSGALLVVRGRPGIGKTRVLGAAAAAARGRGMRQLVAHGGELERNLAFGVVRQLFEPVVARATEAERLRLFAGAARLAEPVVAADTGEAGPPGATFAALHGLHWLTANLADAGPLLALVDDVHWADAPSLRFLAYLVRRLEGVPALVAIAMRTGEPGIDADLLSAIAAAPAARRLSPAPLGRDAVAVLVERALGSPPDEPFASGCHRASGGNPFLLGELLVELAAARVEPVAREVGRLDRVAPEGVTGSVLLRLNRLPDGAVALARAVAVLGDGADLGVAGELAGVPAGRRGELVDALAGAGVLEPSLRLGFVHPLVRAAVAGTLGPAERTRTNRRAAELLAAHGAPAERIAAHLTLTGRVGERWALDALQAAGRRAAASGAPAEAAGYLRRALDEVSDAERPELLLELGAAESRAGNPAAIDDLEAALAAAADDRTRTAAALVLGGTLFAAGRFADAVGVYVRVLGELPANAGEGRLELQSELLNAGRQDLATRPVTLEMLEMLDPELEPVNRAACKVLANLGNEEMAQAGSRERAVALAERALHGDHIIEDEPLLTFPLAASTLTIAGDLERAIQVHDDALARARARGAAVDAGLVAVFRSLALHHRGRLADAVADARAATEVVEQHGAALLAPYAAAYAAFALLDTGDVAAADAALEPVADLASVPHVFAGAYVLSARGRVRLAQGRVDEAAADLRECGRRMADWHVRNPGLVPWRGGLAAAEYALGRVDEALALVDEQLELARRCGGAWALSAALRDAGTLHGDEALLAEAVRIAAAGGARLEHAHALVELGALRRRSGRDAEARESLRAGLDLALGCGAAPLAGRAHEELVAAGAQPRRLRTSGRDALTAAERRVAVMAADGLTNRAIAQALFVTEKTVESHLRSVFRKLGVSSRSQVGAALGDAPAS